MSWFAATCRICVPALVLFGQAFSVAIGTAQAAGPECAFSGPPAVAFGRRTYPDPTRSSASDLVVADSGARCQVTVYSLPQSWDREGFDTRSPTFRFLPEPAGGGVGILVWQTTRDVYGGTCSLTGFEHAVFEVDESGVISTPLPLVPTSYCPSDVGKKENWHYPSISPHGDRIAFRVSTYEPRTFIAIVDSIDGKSLASGIDTETLEFAGEVSLDAGGTAMAPVAWGSSGETLFHYGRLVADPLDEYMYLYELRRDGREWVDRKVFRFAPLAVEGVKRRLRFPTTAMWNYDDSGPREVLAYGIVEQSENANSSYWAPTGIEIIDVSATTDPTRPVMVSRIEGPFANSAFTGHAADGAPPNLFVGDDSREDLAIIELDPGTGECVPDGVCTPFGPTGSVLTRPVAAIGTPISAEPTTVGLEALPVILELLLGEGDATTNQDRNTGDFQ